MPRPLPQNIDELASLLQGLSTRTSRRIHNSFTQQCQLKHLPVLQRQGGDLAILHYILDCCRLSFQMFGTRLNRNYFLRAAHLERDMHESMIVYVQDDVLTDRLFEAWALGEQGELAKG